MNPGELEVFVGMVEAIEAKVVVEIGVHEGRNPMVLLARQNMIERYIGIDVPQNYAPSLPVQRHEVPALPGRLAAHDPRFEMILRPRGSLDLSPDDLPQADAVLIDGDHAWRTVLHDSLLARAIIRPGGVIFWHDYHDLETVDVRGVLDELAAIIPLEHIEGTWWCIEQRPRTTPLGKAKTRPLVEARV